MKTTHLWHARYSPPIEVVDVGDMYDKLPDIGIHDLIWKRFLHPNAEIYNTEYSNLFIIKELINGYVRYHTLDRIAAFVKHKKGMVNAFGKRYRLDKRSANILASDLKQQAEKLRALASSYELMSKALTLSLDELEDVVSLDDTIKKRLDNPF